jgi:hypothetical protein
MLVVGIVLVGASILAHIVVGAQRTVIDPETGQHTPVEPDAGLSSTRLAIVRLTWAGLIIGLALIVAGALA